MDLAFGEIVAGVIEKGFKPEVAPGAIVFAGDLRPLHASHAHGLENLFDAIVVFDKRGADELPVVGHEGTWNGFDASVIVDHQPPIWARTKVPGVRVRVQAVVNEDLLPENGKQSSSDCVSCILVVVEFDEPVQGIGGLKTRSENPLATQSVQHPGNHHAGVLRKASLKVPAHLRFVTKVEFFGHAQAHLVEGFVKRSFVDEGALELGQPANLGKVGVYGAVDSGVLDFDHHFLAFVGARAVHLTDGRGAQRGSFEVREELVRGLSEFGLDLRGHLGVRSRGDVLLQHAKRVSHLGGQQIPSGRGHLT